MQCKNKQRVGAVMMSMFMAVACGQPEEGQLTPAPSGDDVAMTAAPLTVGAGYDSVWKVPRCTAVASGCDTVSLVTGRGSVGPERNAPNTLGGSCADESSGTYKSDESIERVKVYTVDGSNLAPGKQVTLEVDVWAWSGYTSDALDLYAAADASAPVWTLLTTLVPGGAGAQTLKFNYTLPSNVGTQAVRAAFRYGSAAGVCASGSYNDRDDLAFAVEAPAPDLATRIAAGSSNSYQLRQDGTVWAYGGNGRGQLGTGAAYDYMTKIPEQVVGLSQIKAIAAGWEYAVALKQDGTVWAWGENYFGQLGDGTNTRRTTPVQVIGLSNVTAIAVDYGHNLALKSDGTVWAWGYNADGQLGNGTTNSSNSPIQVPSLSGIKAVAAGHFFSMALKPDGTIWTWGYNGAGQLGDGSTTRRTTPGQVTGISGVTHIAAGSNHCMARKSDGTLWVWGSNTYGELGDGTTTARGTPGMVAGMTQVTSIVASKMYGSAVTRADGSVWGWGRNNFGMLGDGTMTNRSVPTKVPDFSGVLALAVGTEHTLALRQDGSVWAWGGGAEGKLGIGGYYETTTPVQQSGTVSVQ